MNDEVSIKFKNVITNQKELEKYAKTLKNVRGLIAGFDSETMDKISDAAKDIKEINGNLKEQKDKVNAAFNYTAVREFTRGLQRAFSTLSRLTTKSADFLENVNLYQVAFDGNYKSADRFINKMAEMYGMDESWLTRTVGIFKQLSNAMNLSVETGEKLSTLMTQMSLDISSLYNIDIDRATSVLQSALAGQTKPIRGATGADITQSTLQTTLDNLGIEQAVNQLSFAEKRLLIIISLTQQLNASIGDMGRTIEQPANQMRVLSMQWERLSRALGDLFLPILAKILPYLNAILMVLTEIISAIAKFVSSLLGFKQQDFKGNLYGVADSAMSISSGLDKATTSAKKLKQGLRGFDKLNVITTPAQGSSGGGVGGGAGGISPKMLDSFNKAFDDYNDKLKNVRMKATEIRDKIMEWLGFTKKVDKETGDVSFKFDHVTGGTVLGALAVGGAIYKGIKFIVTNLQKIGLFKFPIISKLVGLITGSGDKASKTIDAAGNVAGSAKNAAKELKIPSVKTILKGLADVAIIIAGCTAILAAMGLIAKIPGVSKIVSEGVELTSKVFWGLAKVAIPLAAMSALIGVMGSIGVAQFALGLADLAIIIIGCEAVITAVGAIATIPSFKDFISTGIDTTKKVFNGIADVAGPLAVMAAALTLAGLGGGAIAGAIAMGLADLALVVGGMEVVLVAIGALNQIPGFQWLLGEGMKAMIEIAEFLGEFAGTIISSFVEEISSSLPKIGKDLAGFMTNAAPFFDNAGKINAETTQGVKNLALALLALTANEILDTLTSWLTGGASLTEFGKDLAEFGPYFAKYAKSVEKVNPKVVQSSASAAKSLAEFARNIPNEGGVAAWFAGDNNIAKFGKDLASFGPNFKKYADAVDGVKSRVVTESASAAKSLAEFAKNIPNNGGVVSWFAGNNNVAAFGKDLASFGPNFRKYADAVSGIDPQVVEESATAAKSMTTMAKNIPNKDGLVALFTGNNTISDFGKDLKDFGKYFKEYYNNVKGISTNTVNTLTDAIVRLIDSAKKIKDNKITDTLQDFSKSLKKAGPNYTAFFKETFSYSNGLDIGASFGQAIADAIAWKIKNKKYPKIEVESKGGTSSTVFSFTTGLWGFASGGLPPVGQLFVANEKGPELVGQIGGQSFVANQNQMMDLLDKKISNVQTKTPQVFNIYLDENHKIGSYTLEQLQGMAKTNGKPITIM